MSKAQPGKLLEQHELRSGRPDGFEYQALFADEHTSRWTRGSDGSDACCCCGPVRWR